MPCNFHSFVLGLYINYVIKIIFNKNNNIYVFIVQTENIILIVIFIQKLVFIPYSYYFFCNKLRIFKLLIRTLF